MSSTFRFVAASAFGALTPLSFAQSTLDRPDALLQIDLNRVAVVERIIAAWDKDIAPAHAASFKAKLSGLRADQLLAANIAGSLDGVLEILVAHESATRLQTAKSDRSKALGEASRDLIYTPITPCRLLDTRGAFSPVFAGGPFAPAEIRTYQTTGNCGVPVGAEAVVLQVTTIVPTAAGDIEILPQGGTFGGTVAMVFQANVYSSVSITARLNSANGQLSTQIRGPGGNAAMDITGYFMPPTRNADGLRVINASISGNMLSGAAANTIITDVRGGVVAGGGAAINSDPVYGGEGPNKVADHYGFVGGGAGNVAGRDDGDVSGSAFAAVVGGKNNSAEGSLSFVGSGSDNRADGYIAAVVGGDRNRAGSSQAFVGGGVQNQAFGNQSVIGGGASNTAGGNLANVSGGENNSAGGIASVVAGGSSNSAGGENSATSGGFNNSAPGGYAGITSGRFNFASGVGATIIGGENNIASGFYSTAAGRGARTQSTGAPATPHNGSFVWADAGDPLNPLITNFHSSANNQFAVRARGGVVFKTDIATTANDPTAGCALPAGGGAWSCSSDRNLKEHIVAVSPRAILNKVVAMPMTSWQFKGSPNRHLSPMAQDFWKAFGLGVNERTITSTDASGVALAAIQGLNQVVKEKDAKIEAQGKEIDAMKAELAAIKKKLGL